MPSTNRPKAKRELHRRLIARDHPACGICGKPIDYSLPWLDPGAFVVDHIVALKAGGPDVLANKQAAHRSCNRAKSDRPHAPIVKVSGSLVDPDKVP